MGANYTGTADVRAFVKDMKNRPINNRDFVMNRWRSPLDNHNPTRQYGSGFAVKYTNDYVSEAYALFHDDYFGDNRNISFLVDDGESVKPFYLASYNKSGGFYILHPFHSGFDFGPRKMYYIKMTPEVWV